MVKNEECNSSSSSKDFHIWSIAKPCDACRIKSCSLYCKADSAYLCDDCDFKVHGADKVASRHERVWMCEVCEMTPAAVTCKADAAVLCAACDADIHSANPLARRHERVRVAPFFDCARLLKPFEPPFSAAAVVPSLNYGESFAVADEDLATSWLLPKVPPPPPEFFPDVDPYLDVDYASSMDGAPAPSMDSVVPASSDGCDADPPLCHRYASAASLSHSVSSSSLDVGVVPEAPAGEISTPWSGAAGSVAAAGLGFEVAGNGGAATDREARVMRYKEKRKNRKFHKTIRYASRKAYAETRPRIKGRFAKRTDADVERMYASADLGYGLVPSF